MNTIFDGIAQLLADLRAAGVRLGVATSKLEPTARRILAHFGLDQHFEVIAGTSPDGSRKTKAEVLAHALAQLRPLPERVLVGGDRVHDAEGATAHGIDAVVVGWGYGQADFADATTTAAATGAAHVARSTSCGGKRADERANQVLRAHGYPTDHCAAQVDIDHLTADLVVALARKHVGWLRQSGVDAGRIRMLRSFDPRSGTYALDVDDPYYGDDEFEAVFADIEAALPGLHDWVDEQLAQNGHP